MSVISFHRFLISVAILFCLVFAAWALVTAGGRAGLSALGIGFLTGGALLAYYLANLERFLGKEHSRRE
ncbi:MAG: hypothetical protein J4G03_00105 [Gemmatimonadetes bacterium]|nr:hypothetical protein [Gemmatimonadota bacterium]